MIHTSKIQDQHISNFQSGDIQCVCEQLKADIEKMFSESQDLNEVEKFEKLHRLNELKQILSTIEDINHSVDLLLKKQLQKRPSHTH